VVFLRVDPFHSWLLFEKRGGDPYIHLLPQRNVSGSLFKISGPYIPRTRIIVVTIRGIKRPGQSQSQLIKISEEGGYQKSSSFNLREQLSFLPYTPPRHLLLFQTREEKVVCYCRLNLPEVINHRLCCRTTFTRLSATF
jgi:hypothetical protein